jgi:ATP-dependent protease La (LON) substrate-binding domain
MKPIRIPLFPLNVVLFPGCRLPLHIFEHRYRVMVRRCLGEEIEFGIILATDKGVATVGCTAAITQRLKEYPDGRVEILTEGRSVFRVVAGASGIDTHGDVGRLLVNRADHAAGFSIKSEFCASVADVANDFAGEVREVYVSGGGNFASDYDEAGGDQRFAGDAAGGVVR